MSSQTKSENLATATGTRARPPELICSGPFWDCHQISKCRAANGIESNELNRIFANKGNCRKRLRASLYYPK